MESKTLPCISISISSPGRITRGEDVRCNVGWVSVEVAQWTCISGDRETFANYSWCKLPGKTMEFEGMSDDTSSYE